MTVQLASLYSNNRTTILIGLALVIVAYVAAILYATPSAAETGAQCFCGGLMQSPGDGYFNPGASDWW